MAFLDILKQFFSYQFNMQETIILFILIIALSYIIGKTIYAFIKVILRQFTKKSRTRLDDMLLDALDRPFYLLTIIVLTFLTINGLNVWKKEIFNYGIKIIIILWSAYVIVKIIDTFFKWKTLSLKREKVTIYRTYYSLFRRIFSITLYVLAFLIILQELNIEITPIITGLGIGGLAVALALQDTLSNYFAGIYLSTEKYLKLGDFVELPGLNIKGYIEDIGWRSTKIYTPEGNVLIIPNNVLANQSILNFDSPNKPMNCVVTCGVSYETNLEKVEKIAFETAKKVIEKSEHAEKDFTPIIRFYNFGDSNIDFKIIVRAKSFFDQYALQHELIKELKKEFDKHKIVINYPVRTVYLNK